MASVGAAGEKKTIVLIGTTGTGKSTLGNVLLGHKPVKLETSIDVALLMMPNLKHDEINSHIFAGLSSSSSGQQVLQVEGPFVRSDATQSCTLSCHIADGFFLGDNTKPIRIVDTPGHGDSQGRDHSFRDEMIRTMKEQKIVHAFVLAKNAQAPRVDMQDIEFFQILRKIFGAGFFSNVVIVFTRFHHSAVDEARRQRERTTLESKIKGFRKELGDTEGRIPVIAIDALHSTTDEFERAKFKEGCDKLWNVLQTFSEQPMEDLENLAQKKGQAERELQELLEMQRALEKQPGQGLNTDINEI